MKIRRRLALGDTALRTVGRTGNDLHHRDYDILDLAGYEALDASIVATIVPEPV